MVWTLASLDGQEGLNNGRVLELIENSSTLTQLELDFESLDVVLSNRIGWAWSTSPGLRTLRLARSKPATMDALVTGALNNPSVKNLERSLEGDDTVVRTLANYIQLGTLLEKVILSTTELSTL